MTTNNNTTIIIFAALMMFTILLSFTIVSIFKIRVTSYLKPIFYTIKQIEISNLSKVFNFISSGLNLAVIKKAYILNVINSLSNSFVFVSTDAKITIVNQATLQLLGYEEQELCGKEIEVIFTVEEKVKIWDELIKEGYIKNVETTYLTKDGSKIPVSFSGSVMRDLDDGKQEIVCVAQDISERKRAEENLQNSLSLLHATLESTADGILVVNSSGKIQCFNQNFVQMWRIPDFILASQDNNQALEFVAEQLKDPEGFLRKVRELHKQPNICSYDLLEFKNGRVLERYSQPQQLAGRNIGRVCSFRDVSDRKRAEDANALLVTAVEHAAEAIEVTDAKARIVYVNPAFEAFTGYKRSEAMRKTPAALHGHGLFDESFYQTIWNTLASGQAWSGSYIGRRKDGSLYHQEATISPVSNAAGVITHHVAVKRDITERKRAEERLAKINECFLSFGTDPIKNINRLTAICGELLEASYTLYKRLDEKMLCSVGQWQTPKGYNLVQNPDGQICYDVIQRSDDQPFVMSDLGSTTYAQTDPDVMSYGLKTYIAQVVKCKDVAIGVLCAVYQKDFIPSDADKRVIGIIAAAIRVEEERRYTEKALRASEERYALAARGANDGLWDWNLETNEIYFSSRWKFMLGYEDNEIGNSPDEWFSRVHPMDIERVKVEINTHLETVTSIWEFESHSHLEIEYQMLHKNGTYCWMLCRGIAVLDTDGKAYRIAGSQTDITKSKIAEAQLLHDAVHDALTGLPNRVLFMDRLSHALELAKRREDYLFAVLFLDLDRFKVVNDSLGHMIGDQLLIAIAHKLKTCLRPGDTVARLGGDEFTILLENITDVREAIQVANRIQNELTLPFNLNGHEVFTAASIGIALSTLGYHQPEDLLRDADVSMYRAKGQGKGRYEVFDRTMHTQAMALLQLETDLRRALDRFDFRVHYQPIVSLKSGKITGFEALVRLQHPKRGLISPTEFIPVAEETGLIVPIGWWVLREACRQMSAWQMQFPAIPPLTISVNFSSKQFLQCDLVKKIESILQETGLNASGLGLEITESALIENTQSAAIRLKQLREIGVKLFLDDFGTGYSSLSYLHRFPFNTLKIDRSFVKRMGVDSESLEIVRTIVTLAHTLEMNVTAEGVEILAQLAQLSALRCEYGQGYFFSKPLEAEAAEALIAAQQQWYGDLKFSGLQFWSGAKG